MPCSRVVWTSVSGEMVAPLEEMSLSSRTAETTISPISLHSWTDLTLTPGCTVAAYVRYTMLN